MTTPTPGALRAAKALEDYLSADITPADVAEIIDRECGTAASFDEQREEFRTAFNNRTRAPDITDEAATDPQLDTLRAVNAELVAALEQVSGMDLHQTYECANVGPGSNPHCHRCIAIDAIARSKEAK